MTQTCSAISGQHTDTGTEEGGCPVFLLKKQIFLRSEANHETNYTVGHRDPDADLQRSAGGLYQE